jgi:hypothetical protein
VDAKALVLQVPGPPFKREPHPFGKCHWKRDRTALRSLLFHNRVKPPLAGDAGEVVSPAIFEAQT